MKIDLKLPASMLAVSMADFDLKWMGERNVKDLALNLTSISAKNTTYNTLEQHLNYLYALRKKQQLLQDKSNEYMYWPETDHVDKVPIMTYALGSDGLSTEWSQFRTDAPPRIYFQNDLGLFHSVFEVWKNHWALRTKPEDWWFPVARLIAMAIDDAVKNEDRWHDINKKNSANLVDKNLSPVRSFLVNHEGKITLSVDQPVYYIYQADYETVFANFSSEITKTIRVPKFADLMQSSTFSTSTQTTKIVSQINLMAATKQFFKFELTLSGCGIAGVDMMGEESDWHELVNKIRSLRTLLKPILPNISFKINEEWFDHVEYVFENLAKTYSHISSGHGSQSESTPENEWQSASSEVADFWADVLLISTAWKYGPSGTSKEQVEAYNGWLIPFLTGGVKSFYVDEIDKEEVRSKLSGLNTVPMTVKMTWCKPNVEDEAELVAGIIGFTLEKPDITKPDLESGHRNVDQIPILEPYHAWAMMLPPNSPLRASRSMRCEKIEIKQINVRRADVIKPKYESNQISKSDGIVKPNHNPFKDVVKENFERYKIKGSDVMEPNINLITQRSFAGIFIISAVMFWVLTWVVIHKRPVTNKRAVLKQICLRWFKPGTRPHKA